MKMIDCSQPWQSSKLAMCRSKQISLKSYLRLFNISQIFPRVVLYINCWMSTSGRQHRNVRNLLIQINLLNRLLYLKEQQSPISFWFSVRGLFNRILRCQIHTSMHCGFFLNAVFWTHLEQLHWNIATPSMVWDLYPSSQDLCHPQ